MRYDLIQAETGSPVVDENVRELLIRGKINITSEFVNFTVGKNQREPDLHIRMNRLRIAELGPTMGMGAQFKGSLVSCGVQCDE